MKEERVHDPTFTMHMLLMIYTLLVSYVSHYVCNTIFKKCFKYFPFLFNAAIY